MAVRLISVSQPMVPGIKTAEDHIGYCARVSNPTNQIQDPARLLKYCIKNKHWSIFEMANMVVEIKTTRAIAAQILRHRTFTFQEFSQRYAAVADAPVIVEARIQDHKNRQNSFETEDEELKQWWEQEQQAFHEKSMHLYEKAVAKGIAKESARFILPLSTPTTMYMNGTVRSWIHYIELRSGNGTQKEHKEIADACKEIFKAQFPVTADALEW
ncbi:thymidylate synthase [Acanthocystis turfacea Chlorella virus TN603.4.2]|nr:thymidylate synthase [Acanthocystis turfacea Chlorella virus TN603.4.2]